VAAGDAPSARGASTAGEAARWGSSRVGSAEPRASSTRIDLSNPRCGAMTCPTVVRDASTRRSRKLPMVTRIPWLSMAPDAPAAR
jgi:hypothetical protein